MYILQCGLHNDVYFLEFSHKAWSGRSTSIPVIPESGGDTAGMYTESI